MKRVDVRETRYFCGGVIVSSTKVVTGERRNALKN